MAWPRPQSGRHLLVFYQAYIDESESDGLLVLAGHIAPVQNWAALASEWEQLLPRFGTLGDHGYHFKMSEMAATEDRLENVKPFNRLIEKHVSCSISVSLKLADILNARDRLIVPGMRIDLGELANPWMLGFRCLLDMLASNRDMLAELIPPDAPIDFYFDERSEKHKIYRGWDEYLEGRPQLRHLYGNQPVFGSDQKYVALQSADLWAWWIRRWHLAGTPAKIAGPNFGSWEGKRKGFFKADISFNEDQLFTTFKQLAEEILGKASVFDRKTVPTCELPEWHHPPSFGLDFRTA